MTDGLKYFLSVLDYHKKIGQFLKCVKNLVDNLDLKNIKYIKFDTKNLQNDTQLILIGYK